VPGPLHDLEVGESVSFTVSPAPVTVSGGPGIVVTNVWSHGVLTISAD
jgi:hypothetical protein